jgi:hypothetical protein
VLLTVAMAGVPELQVTRLVRSWVLPSDMVPVAVSWAEVPTPTEGVVGETVSDDNVFTVNAVEPEIPPTLAVMSVVPVPTALARPDELMLATAVDEELQLAARVTSRLLPSGKVPMALNCWVAPAIAEGLGGVTVIEVGPWTVIAALADAMPGNAAVMVVVPGATAVATPLDATLAVCVSAALQVTRVETSLVVPSERVPVATNCSVSPSVAVPVVFAAATVSDTILSMRTEVEPVIPAVVALTVTVPVPSAVRIPLVLMVATEGSELLQDTRLLRSWVAPLERVAVARNCCEEPTTPTKPVGVTAIDCTEAVVRVALPVTVPEVAEIVVVPAAAAVAKPCEPGALLMLATAPLAELQVTESLMSIIDPLE